jgi:hypothetical protein
MKTIVYTHYGSPDVFSSKTSKNQHLRTTKFW